MVRRLSLDRRVGNFFHGGVAGIIRGGKYPSIGLCRATNRMGLRFGEEEKYPQIGHLGSSEDMNHGLRLIRGDR